RLRDPVPHHEGAREALARLEARGGCARAEDGDALPSQAIGEAGSERILGPDHDQIDALAAADLGEGGGIVRPDLRQAGCVALHSRIPRRREHAAHTRAARDLPGEGVAGTPGAGDEDVHPALLLAADGDARHAAPDAHEDLPLYVAGTLRYRLDPG